MNVDGKPGGLLKSGLVGCSKGRKTLTVTLAHQGIEVACSLQVCLFSVMRRYRTNVSY